MIPLIYYYITSWARRYLQLDQRRQYYYYYYYFWASSWTVWRRRWQTTPRPSGIQRQMTSVVRGRPAAMWGHRRRHRSCRSDTAAALTHRPPPPHRIVSLLSARPTRRHRCRRHRRRRRRRPCFCVPVCARVRVWVSATSRHCEPRAAVTHRFSTRSAVCCVRPYVVTTRRRHRRLRCRRRRRRLFFRCHAFSSPPTQRKQ